MDSKKQTFSLDDERRVKSLSPGTLTLKRFLRNRLAVAGLVILAVMFLFSFLGGFLTPYEQDQVFYRRDVQRKEYAGVTQNNAFRFLVPEGQQFGPVLQAQFNLKKDSFTWQDVTYTVTPEGEEFYSIFVGQTLVAAASKDVLHGDMGDFEVSYQALRAYANGQPGFIAHGQEYTLSEGSVLLGGEELGYISRLIVSPKVSGTVLSPEFREQVTHAIENGTEEFTLEDRHFRLAYDAAGKLWSVREEMKTLVWDAYAAPTAAHPLGTDKNGMDMLTRLMYGGRVSLVIGFIVVFISALIGVVLGGVAGYFGKWVDNLIMRLVDVFHCIPSTPLLIILGAAMDGMRVDPQIRMLLLMLILGVLGWPSIARLVRGQILSLREQEFMTAAEAAGLSVRRRIFRHLLPNVIPQLIVTCTAALGSAILTEATLSFLGLGVKFPFASWGNIMNDVSNAHVLTSYWFVWIPAGVCLVLAVLGFNFVGDGLRDAFDPKMKR